MSEQRTCEACGKEFIVSDKEMEEEKILDSERNKTQIYSQVLFRRELTKKTSLNLKARQIQDATVPIFPSSATGEARKVEWELNGGLTFRL